MKILKRNQIIISVLALMLITVGYMSYTSNIHNAIETGSLMEAENVAGIGDARLVNSDSVEENNTNETAESATSTEKSSDNTSAASSISSNTVNNDSNTSSNSTSKTTSAYTYQADYFVASKLEREKMYSQMLESYKGLLENSSISSDQKDVSTQEIAKINNKKNSIMIAENLIKNLGFEDVVIFVNDNSTSVIVKAEKLSEADIAQIQNIVCREIGVDVEEIHISLK